MNASTTPSPGAAPGRQRREYLPGMRYAITLLCVLSTASAQTNDCEALKREAADLGLTIQVVERSNAAREFEILLAQESSMAGAAAAAGGG